MPIIKSSARPTLRPMLDSVVVVPSVAVTFDEEFSGITEKERPMLGFILTGFSSGERLRGTFIIENSIDGKLEVSKEPVLAQQGITAKGQPEAVHRLVYGFSFGLLLNVINHLQLDEENTTSMMKLFFQDQMPLIHPAMPLQDSIDLARFLVQTAVDYQRFKFDDKTIGGPIEIATMTKYEGFKWVQRKHFYESSLNPGSAK